MSLKSSLRNKSWNDADSCSSYVPLVNNDQKIQGKSASSVLWSPPKEGGERQRQRELNVPRVDRRLLAVFSTSRVTYDS